MRQLAGARLKVEKSNCVQNVAIYQYEGLRYRSSSSGVENTAAPVSKGAGPQVTSVFSTRAAGSPDRQK